MNNTFKIGVFFNTDKKKGKSICGKLLALLKEYSSSVFLLKYSVKDGIDLSLVQDMIDSVDVIFAIGGDGTLLSAQRHFIGTDISIICINAGRKGFLIELDEESMEEGIKNFFEGKYYVERRNTLFGCVQNVETKEIVSSDIAINEFSISRNSNTGIIKIRIYVNGVLMKSFQQMVF
jgi:NAD+ kinase